MTPTEETLPVFCFFCRARLEPRKKEEGSTMTFYYDTCSNCKAKIAERKEKNKTK